MWGLDSLHTQAGFRCTGVVAPGELSTKDCHLLLGLVRAYSGDVLGLGEDLGQQISSAAGVHHGAQGTGALTPWQAAQPHTHCWVPELVTLAQPLAWCVPSDGKLPSPCPGKKVVSEVMLRLSSLWFAAAPFKVRSGYKDAKGPEQNVTARS